MLKLSMIKHVFVVLLWLPLFAFAGQNSQHVAVYLQLWLNEHHVQSVIDENNVLALPATGLKISGEILQATQRAENAFIVETQLRVQLPDNRTIVENVAGIGTTAEEAFMDSLLNLCVTTFHPILAGFIDSSDSHMDRQEIALSGINRTIFLGEWGLRGDEVSPRELADILSHLFTSLRSLQLDGKTHWIKLVVLSIDGQIDFIAFTLDNEVNEAVVQELGRFDWPVSENFYMLKLFFVVGQSE